jgi:hypothetical protein
MPSEINLYVCHQRKRKKPRDFISRDVSLFHFSQVRNYILFRSITFHYVLPAESNTKYIYTRQL